MSVEILVLGAGWTSTFLQELCDAEKISYASTSRSGRDSTIPFVFDPGSEDLHPYTLLPTARTVLVTFPITVKGASERLIRFYCRTHDQDDNTGANKTRFVQLGTTGMWNAEKIDVGPSWYDRHSLFTPTPRSEAEEELLAMSPRVHTTVLNLSGLWGGARSPKNWVNKVAPSKEALRAKGSIHLIHGMDVARGVLAVHDHFEKASGQRWILSDGRVYDWWDLVSAWGSKGSKSSHDLSLSDDQSPHQAWVRELMDEDGLRALPRSIELLGRALDSRDFWKTFNLSPIHARIEE